MIAYRLINNILPIGVANKFFCLKNEKKDELGEYPRKQLELTLSDGVYYWRKQPFEMGKIMSANSNGRVFTVTPEQAEQLRRYAVERDWELSSAPYARFRIAADHLSIVAYLSGKLVVQGRNAEDFIAFVLEPEILKTWCAAAASVEEFSPHGGVDESGKGDFFGPLVISGVCVNADTAPLLRQLGVCDSKLISTSGRIVELARGIRRIAGSACTTVVVNPETYNRLYADIGNLNRLLAWGHARVIENLLTAVPDCPRMLSDKFGNERLIRNALMTKGRTVKLDQQVRAESDVAVAAASILAREGFLAGMRRLSEEVGLELPRGAGPQVKATARQLWERSGKEVFRRCAKLHFKTFAEIQGNADNGHRD